MKHKFYERARMSFYDQKKRCEKPKNKMFKWYGEKGIKVIYSLKEFIYWYIKESEGFSRPTVDRINHNNDYNFDNIQIVEKSENSKERIFRLGTPKQRRKVIVSKNGIDIFTALSTLSAAILVNGYQRNVYSVCRGLRKSHRGFKFRFLEV